MITQLTKFSNIPEKRISHIKEKRRWNRRSRLESNIKNAGDKLFCSPTGLSFVSITNLLSAQKAVLKTLEICAD
jgi:hypothetical protein